MHYLSEQHILVFLIQLAVLLGLARLVGSVLQRFGQPTISGEILVGVVLGPTLMGRLAPTFHQALFPATPVQGYMLDTVAWLGILFFLLTTGLETDFSVAWRQRKEATIISVSDLIIPMAIAFLPCLFIPQSYLGNPDQRLLFALFVATIMTISALPVTARVLQDLNIYRSDTGLLIMCALTINDIIGWLIFAVILGFATDAGMSLSQVFIMFLATLAFATVCLTVGRSLTDRAFGKFHEWKLPEPGASLTFLCILGLIGGAITLKIGVHALFGFFIVGIMAGEAKALSEKTRHVITEMVRAVLVPVFFTTIGLKIDFVQHFHLGMVVFILAIGVFGRFLGAWLGVLLTGRHASSRHLISVAHTPGGEMQIVIGLLALEYHVISETVFVAIVIGAVVSSALAGPWMKWALSRSRGLGILRFFAREGIVARLSATNRDDAIRELCVKAADILPGHPSTALGDAVLAREENMSTALGLGVAVPHARVKGLEQVTVIVGRSVPGVEWNAPDGMPAHLFFLVLTPLDDDRLQIQILRGIAAVTGSEEARGLLRSAHDEDAMYEAIKQILTSVEPHNASE